MHEVMTFPKNPFDYLKQYSFKDTEEIYTNGSMLIPTHRVETLLVHYKQELLDDIVKELEDLYNAPLTETAYNNGWQTCAQIAIEQVKRRK